MEKWIGRAVGLMHVHKIKQSEIGKKMGVSGVYVNLILNGKKKPKDAESRIMAAIDEIIAERALQQEV